MTGSGGVTRLAVKQIRRGALIVAAVCGGMSALVAAQYQTTFGGSIDNAGLQAIIENPAIRILFGQPVALDNPGGFTVWRTGTPLLLLAGVWMLLTATRVTRGDEDAGRWDLLLGGRLRLVDLVWRNLAVLAGAAVLIGLAVACALQITGTDRAGTVVYALAFAAVTLTFASTGLLAAQILPTKSSAVGLTVAVLGAGLLLRMLADGVPALAWANWVTPFGLVARAAPYAENRIAPLLVLAAAVAVLTVATLLTARQRDLGGGLVAVATSRAPHTRLLGSLGGFAVRRGVKTTLGWAAGIAAYFILVGALITAILEFFAANPRFAELAAAAGFSGLDSADGFAAALFGIVAIPSGLYGAARLATFVADENARRWTSLIAAPVSRTRLSGNEVAAATVGVVLLHLTAGLAMWIGAAATAAPLGIAAALAGALNTVPVAWLAVCAAALAAGWLPSATGAVGASPVAGGFLLDVIAESARAPRWVVDLSPFAHIAAVPAVAPAWAASTAMVLLGAGLAALGIAGYRRRDLNT